MHRWINPPIAFAIVALAMWGAARSGWWQVSFPFQRWLGGAAIALGAAIVAVSLRTFARAGTTPNPMRPGDASALVTSGPYARSRNPMYVADAIILVGIAVWLGSIPGLLLVAAFVAWIDRVQIPQEERALSEIFGDGYAAYRARVPRWL
jgi:protein-S-isoprenylcysteine O-methyltransferase Ste14